MIRSLCYSQSSGLNAQMKPDDIAGALKDSNELIWMDFQGTPPDEDEPILRQIFGFHPLAIDDALQENHVPKIDDWEQYLYVVLHAVVLDRTDDVHIDTIELDVFLGPNYIVTHHDEPISALDKEWANLQKDERHLKQGPDHLFYRLADQLIAGYMQVVEELDDEIEAIEDNIFDNPTPQTLESTFNLKRSVARLRRILSPLREVFNKLARDNYAMIDARDRVYFRDIYDHLVRMYDITESMRDLIGGVLDTYLSVINNRMNDIMKTLTTITTLFMPISFIASFFGMNYFQPVADLTRWTDRPSFYLMLSIVILMPLGMSLWMRRRHWM